uniref:Uncharacterized protein n=1 Tax=Anguilla anguilla TaxID=7936 RepID=A0A0E9XNX6_ANGAN
MFCGISNITFTQLPVSASAINYVCTNIIVIGGSLKPRKTRPGQNLVYGWT